jgi:phage recombination protein Bet
MNQAVRLHEEAKSKSIQGWYEQYPDLAIRGIDEQIWNALSATLYPGAQMQSILMAWDYCAARKLDIMLKPVHLVPMSIKTGMKDNAGKDIYESRDVPMPGIGLYRIQASRTGDYAGSSEPEFGPAVTHEFAHEYKGNATKKKVTFPEWCKYTVQKLIGDRIVSFSVKEFWLENYATQSRYSDLPNAMWEKRPYAQLAKCAEAQALRRGWPEIGQDPTAEEMEGKAFDMAKDVSYANGGHDIGLVESSRPTLELYADEKFNKKFSNWQAQISSGERTAQDVIATISSRFEMTSEQINKIESVEIAQ